MNSTISKITIGDEFFVPFWVLLQFLDTTPPDPFIRVKILKTSIHTGIGQDGPIEFQCCDISCNGKIQLTADGIPAEYLIALDDIDTWKVKIADWFKDFNAH